MIYFLHKKDCYFLLNESLQVNRKSKKINEKWK